MIVSVDHASKRFGEFAALRDVSLETRDGEFLALLGPSGSGKTTLLRSIAGLEFLDQGRIRFAGQDMTGLPAAKRRVGFVFQHYALFRHMTVARNIAFGLDVRQRRDRPPRAEIAARVEELLARMQLGGLGGRYPAQLSGGQRQRVALARALAVEPRVLLLDEPFGALDAQVRHGLRLWLRRVHDDLKLTSIFVTHDQEEALGLADRVVVMSAGRIEQIGTPREVYDRPATAFVCGFLGQTNRLPCRLAGSMVAVEGVTTPNLAPVDATGPGEAFIRPHELRLLPPDATDGWPATVVRVTRSGPLSTLECEALGRLLEAATLDLPAGLAPGSSVRLAPSAARAYPAQQ